jgi:hypothetical protein
MTPPDAAPPGEPYRRCATCRRPLGHDETTWPPESGAGEACQECWEDYCGRSWWEAACLVTAMSDALYGDDDA